MDKKWIIYLAFVLLLIITFIITDLGAQKGYVNTHKNESDTFYKNKGKLIYINFASFNLFVLIAQYIQMMAIIKAK